MPTISEELGFKKLKSVGWSDHTGSEFGDDVSTPKLTDIPAATIIRAPPAVARASAGPMPAPYETQILFAANADASATAMAAMAAAEAAVKAPAQSKVGSAKENEDKDACDEPYNDTLQSDGHRWRKKRSSSSESPGDVASNDTVATGGVTGGVEENEYDEQALDSDQQDGATSNIGEAVASERRRRNRSANVDGSAYDSGSQQEAAAADAAAVSAMALAVPSDMQTPGNEEEEDEEEMIRRLAWIKYYVKNSDADKALELGWDGDMSFIDGPVASIAPSPAAGVASGSALTVDPQKTMCRI